MAIDPIVGFCLWRDKDFCSMEEVEAHNADNMKACPVHEELINRPGGCRCVPLPAIEKSDQNTRPIPAGYDFVPIPERSDRSKRTIK
jgi:hypothetical protein